MFSLISFEFQYVYKQESIIKERLLAWNAWSINDNLAITLLLPQGKWRERVLGLVSYQAGSRATFRIHLMQSMIRSILSFIVDSWYKKKVSRLWGSSLEAYCIIVGNYWGGSCSQTWRYCTHQEPKITVASFRAFYFRGAKYSWFSWLNTGPRIF